MYLLCVPLWVQIGQVVLIALVLIGYVLYRPPAAKRPAAKSPQVEAEPANGAAGSSSKADGAANGKPKWLRM